MQQELHRLENHPQYLRKSEQEVGGCFLQEINEAG